MEQITKYNEMYVLAWKPMHNKSMRESCPKSYHKMVV